MPDPTETPPDEKVETQPPPNEPKKHTEEEAQKIMRSMFGALDDEVLGLKPLPPDEKKDDKGTDPAPGAEKPGATEGDKGGAAAPGAAAPATPPPATDAVKPPQVTTLSSEEILASQKRIEAKLEALNKPATTPAQPPTKPIDTPQEDDFEKTLPEENREIIDLLKWADDKPEFKGRATEMRNYFKKESDFLATNPSTEDLEEWRKKNRPNIGESAIRKLTRDKLKAEAKEEAKAEIRKETSAELEALRKRQEELEIKPVLAEAEVEFRSRFKNKNAALPEGVARMDPDVAAAIIDGGLAEAVDRRLVKGTAFEKTIEKYPTEAPILLHYALSAKEYMDVAHGIKPFNVQDPIHQFLQTFIVSQEQATLRGSEATRTRDGKPFIPRSKYNQLSDEDRAKYWTFDHQDVRQMLEIAAHSQVKAEVDRVEKQAERMGFVRKEAGQGKADLPKSEDNKPKPAAEKPPQTPPSTPAPKGGASILPGAANNKPNLVPAAESLRSLYGDLPARLAAQQ